MCLGGTDTKLQVQISLFAWSSVYPQTHLACTVDVSLPLLRCGSNQEGDFSGL